MKTPVYSSRFRKEYKQAQKRGLDLSKIKNVIALLINEIPLPPQNLDHALKGGFVGCRECHIGPDWLLIYKIDGDDLILLRTGSHIDLF